MVRAEVTRPRPGTRPANRRELILHAARDLFLRRGYDHVSVSDIAAAVSIGPSALYRHFPGKQQILLEVLRGELAALDRTLSAQLEGHLTEPRQRERGDLYAIAQLALQFRGVRPLMQREARHLDPTNREEVRASTRTITRKVGQLVRRIRPELDDEQAELLTWAVVGVSSSTNLRMRMDPGPFGEHLVALVSAVVYTPFPADDPSPRAMLPVNAPRLTSRRELILDEATRLFAERGYSHIAVEDIGAASGISGPSVYNHVPAKLDLLVVPLRRGLSFLMHDLGQQMRLSEDAREALQRLTRSYVTFTLTSPHLVTLLVTEVRNLPDHSRRAMLEQQLVYAREWAALLRQVRPELSPARAEATVYSVLMVVGDVARIPRLTVRPDTGDFLTTMALRMLFGDTARA